MSEEDNVGTSLEDTCTSSSPLLPSLPRSTSRTIFLSSFSPTFTLALPSVWPCSDRWREETLLPPPCVRSPVLWGLKDPKKTAAMCVTEAKHARVFPDPESRPDLESEPDPDLSFSVAQCVLALLLLTSDLFPPVSGLPHSNNHHRGCGRPLCPEKSVTTWRWLPTLSTRPNVPSQLFVCGEKLNRSFCQKKERKK